ncbi:MAG: hypothetical protein IT373_23655 [Polyangiaceae bacterium]|nr:hypothetical protein [Polyangiaceae bacterium]
MGSLLVQPAQAGEEYIPELPTLRPEDVGFGFGEYALELVVPHESHRFQHTRPSRP